MIHFFSSVEVANTWLERNQRHEVVAISAGHVSGSVLVAVRSNPESPGVALTEEQLSDPAMYHPIPKRGPGRPPKVK